MKVSVGTRVAPSLAGWQKDSPNQLKPVHQDWKEAHAYYLALGSYDGVPLREAMAAGEHDDAVQVLVANKPRHVDSPDPRLCTPRWRRLAQPEGSRQHGLDTCVDRGLERDES